LRVHGDDKARNENNHHLKRLLEQHQIDYKILHGSYENRLKNAMAFIEELF
jgi:HTH-type transcriptional repressor of NAD biosynthesis genes